MQRVIITGATGAIGTALINVLLEQNIEVLVLCREDSVRNAKIPEHPLLTRKYCSLQQLSLLQNDTGKTYDIFYHFAWEGTIGSGRNDMYLQNANVHYALDAVKAAKEFGCHTFIGAGSQAEYGRFEGQLCPDTPTFPEMGYGYAKLCAGMMTRDYAHQLGLRHIWTRILSVYGPNDGSETMIMSTIRKLQAGITPEFTKGEQLWDYLYSEDAARAFYLLGEKGVDGKVYVLGSGDAKPLAEYIYEIRDLVAPEVEVKLGAIPYSQNQVMHLCANIDALRVDCGFEPEVCFGDGVKMILEQG